MSFSVQNSRRFGLKRLLGAIRSFSLILLISLILTWIFKPVFYHLLILFNSFILLFCVLFCFLSLKFLHSWIVSPWSFISTNFWGITFSFSRCFPFSLQLFFAFRYDNILLHIMITKSLFKHLLSNMCLFNMSRQMILLFVYHIFSVKSICFLRHFFNLHRCDINFRSRVNQRHRCCWLDKF